MLVKKLLAGFQAFSKASVSLAVCPGYTSELADAQGPLAETKIQMIWVGPSHSFDSVFYWKNKKNKKKSSHPSGMGSRTLLGCPKSGCLSSFYIMMYTLGICIWGFNQPWMRNPPMVGWGRGGGCILKTFKSDRYDFFRSPLSPGHSRPHPRHWCCVLCSW